MKAVFLDYDGTLYSHQNGRIPDSAVSALRTLKKRGVKTVLSTGRHISELRRMEELRRVEFDAFVTVNGAVSYDRNGIIKAFPIEKEDIMTTYAWLKAHPMGVQFLEAEENWVNLVNEHVRYSLSRINEPVPKIMPLKRILEVPVYQMIPYGIKDAEPLLARLKGVQALSWFDDDAIDLVHADAGKPAGIQAVLDYWDIPVSETIAFGDGINDEGMLAYCGIGVAMGNGEEKLKAMADYVTDSIDQDGLAKALKHFGMIN
jgi:hypothetical protein